MPRPNRGYELSEKPNDRGYYEIRWCERGRSRRRSTGTGDRREAKKIFAQFLIEVETFKTRHAAPTVGVLLDDYRQEHVRAGKVASTDTQERCIRYLEQHFGKLRPGDIRPHHVASYGQRRAAGTIGGAAGDSTIRRELTALVAALNHARKAQRIKLDEIPHIELPETAEVERKWLTERARAHYLDNIEKETSRKKLTKIYVFSVVALETAARRGAIQDLKWDQVDFEQGRINFNPSGRKQTKKRRPIVPISDALMPVLRRAFLEKTDDYVVGNDWDATKAVRKASAAAGLAGVSPHVFRHTYATLALQAGVTIFDVAGVLGDDPQTVFKHYGHHCPDHLRQAVNFRSA